MQIIRKVKESYVIRYELPPADYNGYSTTAEVAEWLGVSARKLRDWRRKGKGPKYDLFGSRYVYKPQYLEDYIGDVCTYLATNDGTGLLPILGTKLEPAIRQWIEAAGGKDDDHRLTPQSPDRDAAVLLVERYPSTVFIPAAPTESGVPA